MKKKLFLLLYVLMQGKILSFAQVNQNPNGEELFAWEVKQIDEFIDRFNNSDHTLIKKYIQEEYDFDDWKRSDLIISLFDQKLEWDREQIARFLSDITGTTHPPYLDFYDEDWYAEITCLGDYKGEEREFTLILKIEKIPSIKASKWVIEAVEADFLKLPPSEDLGQSLHPASYGTNFIGLFEALSDTANFKNYISKRFNIENMLPVFFNELHQGNLKYKQVNNISYQFLQIPGWFFQVDYTKRNSTNSGWLISDLYEMTDEQKKIYKSDILHLPSLGN